MWNRRPAGEALNGLIRLYSNTQLLKIFFLHALHEIL